MTQKLQNVSDCFNFNVFVKLWYCYLERPILWLIFKFIFVLKTIEKIVNKFQQINYQCQKNDKKGEEIGCKNNTYCRGHLNVDVSKKILKNTCAL